MSTKLTHASRIELADSLRQRYQSSSGKAKKSILKEFIASTGYHPKYALHLLNAVDTPLPKRQQTRRRSSLYDDVARQALIVLWEASDRVCGKRLQPLLRILLPALERHGHLKLDESMRSKVLSMSAATIDRCLRTPRNTARTKKTRRVMPEIRRRVPVRTFADWREPSPGSMEMDLVGHCGERNKGSYVHSLVLTDIASGWTECAPLVVRESGLLIETLERIRTGLPFAIRALDVDNGSEFVNEAMIHYCLRHGIELTRSRPYRKNDQAWIEQKNGAVVRKLLGYRRFEGIAAAHAIGRLYGASRLFVNFFQPSFKLAEKHRQGAKVSKRYHPPETPYERLLQSQTLSDAIKSKLSEVGIGLDPLKLLEEMRNMQSHLAILSDRGGVDVPSMREPDLPAFLASLSDAWRTGEVRPTHSKETQLRYLRPVREVFSVSTVATRPLTPRSEKNARTVTSTVRLSTPQLDVEIERRCELQRQDLAKRHIRRRHAFDLIWPLIERRLEGHPNLNASELLDELRAQYPGRFHLGQLAALTRRVNLWREDARARGVEIGKRSHRTSGLPRTWRTRVDPFEAHWPEVCEWLGKDPDQTALELFVKLRSKYPDCYSPGQVRTLQRRLKCWRQDSVRRLIFDMQEFTQDVGSGTD